MGATIVGGVIGGLVGVAAHVGLELYGGSEHPWFAIVIGLLTGLGARLAVGADIRHASILRGALAALIGAGSIVGGMQALASLATKRVEAAAKPRLVDSAPVDAGEEGDDEATPTDQAFEAGPEFATTGDPGATLQAAAKTPKKTSAWQFVYIAVGVFLAYNLARGGGAEEDEAAAADQPTGEGGDEAPEPHADDEEK